MNRTRLLTSTDLPLACSRHMDWRRSERFPNFWISECGDVVRSTDGARIRGSIDQDGYHVYSITDFEGNKKHISAHRLVAICFLGLRKFGNLQVAHKNGSRVMNHFSNLKWAPPLENHDDRRSHGTGPAGEKNPKAKITDDDVRSIREMHKKIKMRDVKMKVSDLAAMYGLHHATICAIVKRKTWAHVA